MRCQSPRTKKSTNAVVVVQLPTTREIRTKLDEQEIRDPAELTYISYSSRTGDPHVTLARAIYKINTRG